MKKITSSQAVGILALIAALAIPFLISYLQSERVHINPLYVAYTVPLLTMIAGSCRSYLSRFSGTGTGLWAGADTKALARNAGNIAALAMQIVGIGGKSPGAVTAAVNSIVVRAADLDGIEAAKNLQSAEAPAPVNPAPAPPANDPGETTGQFIQTQAGLIKIDDNLQSAEAPAPAPVGV